MCFGDQGLSVANPCRVLRVIGLAQGRVVLDPRFSALVHWGSKVVAQMFGP